jgi:hypothetical protein
VGLGVADQRGDVVVGEEGAGEDLWGREATKDVRGAPFPFPYSYEITLCSKGVTRRDDLRETVNALAGK